MSTALFWSALPLQEYLPITGTAVELFQVSGQDGGFKKGGQTMMIWWKMCSERIW